MSPQPFLERTRHPLSAHARHRYSRSDPNRHLQQLTRHRYNSRPDPSRHLQITQRLMMIRHARRYRPSRSGPRPQSPTKPLHPGHDDNKSYSTGLPVRHRMKYSNTLQYRQPTSQRPSTVPYIKDDPFFEIHHPIYRHIGPRR